MITTLIDLPISLAVQSINSMYFDWIMKTTSWWGEPEHFIVILALTGAGLIFGGKYRESVVLISTTTISALLGSIIKELVGRPRPTSDLVRIETYTIENSFPSNHVLVFSVFFGLLILFVKKSKLNKPTKNILTTVFVSLIILVSFSRIYIGAHWFTDCLASYFIGSIILFLVNKYYRTSHKPLRTKHL